MSSRYLITEIAAMVLEAGHDYSQYCEGIPAEKFFHQPPGKWSPAMQTRHLFRSTNMARLGFTLPKFMVRWIGGRPNRASRTYEELVNRYQQKLQQGGRASGRYIPPPIPESYGQIRLLQEFDSAMKKFAAAIAGTKKEEQLDQYLAPHPLLGKITLRELAYFTIHHARHHQQSIAAMLPS